MDTLTDSPVAGQPYTLPDRPGKGQWAQLCSFLNYWNHKPDTDVLKIVLATALSHYDLDAKPVFLMVVGPSAIGKSSIMMRSLDYLPNPRSYAARDMITSKSFISGQTKGLLFQLPRIPGKAKETHGILGLSDYSTILGMDDTERKSLEAQMRVIYDQKFSRVVGIETSYDLLWRGKVTIIAGCTNAFDSMYDTLSELGQRMIIVRMPKLDDKGYAAKANLQEGHEAEIKQEFKVRVRSMLKGLDDGKFSHIVTPPDINTCIERLSAFTATLRAHVAKTEKGEVMRKPSEETAARLTKVYRRVALGLAKLARRDEVTLEDYELLKRIARDSVPPERIAIMEHLPIDKDGDGEIIDLREFKGIVDASDMLVPFQFRTGITDLQALGLICTGKLDEYGCLIPDEVMDEEEKKSKDVWLTVRGSSLLKESRIATVGSIAATVRSR